MTGKRKNDIRSKRLVKKIIALVCVACFVFVFLFSAIHFTALAGNTGQNATACQRTLMPECKCEIGITQMRVQIQPHTHNETHIDCFVCVIVQKTVEQTRNICTAGTEIILSDLSPLILAGSCFLLMVAGSSTPVKLKTRTNN